MQNLDVGGMPGCRVRDGRLSELSGTFAGLTDRPASRPTVRIQLPPRHRVPISGGHCLQDGETARDCGVICRFSGTGEDQLLQVRAQDAPKVSVGK